MKSNGMEWNGSERRVGWAERSSWSQRRVTSDCGYDCDSARQRSGGERSEWWTDLLDGLNRVRRLHVQRDGLARQSLDEDLHGSTAQAQHQVERRLFLNVVVGQRAPVLQLAERSDTHRQSEGEERATVSLRPANPTNQ